MPIKCQLFLSTRKGRRCKTNAKKIRRLREAAKRHKEKLQRQKELKELLKVTNVINDPITEEAYNVLHNVVSLACIAVKKKRTYTKCASKSSNLSQIPSNNNISTLPLLTNDTYNSSVPQSFHSSQVAESSVTVSDNCSLPVVSSTIQSTSPKQVISNNNLSISPEVSTAAVPTIKISRPQRQRNVGMQSKFEEYQFFEINRRKNKRLKTYSKLPTRKGQKITQHNVGTQINFDEVKSFETSKEHFPAQKLPVPIKGRTIIDFEFFLKKLKIANNHSEFGCNLNNMIIKKGKKVGICTSYNLRCLVCDFETQIWSENLHKKNNLNYDFVSGMLSINCSFDAINKLLTTMCLPNLKRDDFDKELIKIASNKIVWTKSYRCTSKNVTKKPQETSVHSISPTSDNNNVVKQVDPSALLIEDQFEIKEEYDPESENEGEFILPLQTMNISDDKVISDKEQTTLNMTTIKQEYLNEDNLICSIAEEKQTSNTEKPIENNKQSKVVSSEQRKVDCKNRVVNNQQISDTNIMKQEINSHLGNEELTNSLISEIQISNKETLPEKDKQSKVMLSQQNEVGAYKNRMVLNQEQVNHKNGMIGKINQDNNRLVEHEFNNMGIIDKENVTDFHNRPESELVQARLVTHENRVVVNQEYIKLGNKQKLHSVDDYEKLAKKKNSFCYEKKSESITSRQQTSFTVNEESRESLHTDKLNIPTDMQGFPTTTRKEENIFESKFEPITTASSSSTTAAVCGGNVIATSSINTNKEKTYLKPVQFKPKSLKHDALIIQEIPHRDQDAILNLNNYNRQGFTCTALPGGYVPNMTISSVVTETDCILKGNEYNSRQHSISTTLPRSYVPNTPVSAVETGISPGQDILKERTATYLGSSNKSSSCVTSISSPVEIIDITNEKDDDDKNVQQMTPTLQSFSNSTVALKHLSNINMQVNSVFSSFSDVQCGATYAEVPSYLYESQGVMESANSDYSILDISNSNSKVNTKKTFQVPSVSSTTLRQPQAKHRKPISNVLDMENWNHIFSKFPSVIENKKDIRRKRKMCCEYVNECTGSHTKNNCGTCFCCKNVRSRHICKCEDVNS